MSASLGQLKCKRLIALHLRSTAPKKITCTNYVQVIFYAREIGLERDVKKTAQRAVFSPRRVNRVSGANKGVQNACARRVAEQVPSTAPTEKTILLSSFFHFLPKMMRRCRSVGAHVRCARATQMQALDCPSLAVDRTKKNNLHKLRASYFLRISIKLRLNFL